MERHIAQSVERRTSEVEVRQTSGGAGSYVTSPAYGLCHIYAALKGQSPHRLQIQQQYKPIEAKKNKKKKKTEQKSHKNGNFKLDKFLTK